MTALAPGLQIAERASLRDHNTFGLPALAQTLVRVTSDADVQIGRAHV